MTLDEKAIFDKLQVSYKKDVDYFNEKFDMTVKD